MSKISSPVSCLALLILSIGAVCAEPSSLDPFMQDDEGAVYYETIVESPDVTADDLFTMSEDWIDDRFHSDTVEGLQTDSNRDWIRFVTYVETPKGWKGMDSSGDGYLRMQIELAFKEGRTRLRIRDFHFLISDRWGGNGKMRVDVSDKELFLKKGKKQKRGKEELAQQMVEISDSLGKTLEVAEDSDW